MDGDMTPGRFRYYCRVVYGPRWKGKVGRWAGVNKRVVQRWAKGEMAVPPEVSARLLDLFRDCPWPPRTGLSGADPTAPLR